MFEKLRKIIEEHDSIVIFGHPNPDGDCFGSQIALRDTIRLNFPNKKVFAVGSGIRRFRKYICEMDIGHTHPHLTMINGALVRVRQRDGRGSIAFSLK